jgi:hypothetical protein
MTPKRYLLLRRLNLARGAVDEAVLYEADPGERRDRLHVSLSAEAGRLPGQCQVRLPALS